MRKVTESVEDLNEVSELVKRLREKEKDQCEKAALLKKIAVKLQPYIQGIGQAVSLGWGVSIDGDEYTALSPESKYTANDCLQEKVLFYGHHLQDPYSLARQQAINYGYSLQANFCT